MRLQTPKRTRYLHVIRLACLSAACLAGAQRATAADYKLKLVTDRENALYETGETAKFVVTVTDDGKPVTAGSVSYIVDDYVTDRAPDAFPRGILKLNGKPQSVAVSLKTPGFLRCRVTFIGPDKKRLQATAGAGFSPLKIGLSLPVPDDFDAFWAAQKAELAKVPLDPKLTDVKSPDANIVCFDVQVQCTGGAPVSGYFGKPSNAKPKSLPAILWVHGAGVRGSALGNAITGARAGMLSMDINAHGIPNGKPGKFYQELNSGKLRNYRYTGREKRETSYFRGMYLRLVRAIDFLTAQPEWDGKTVIVIGHSQGGGQSLVAGGIDSRVTMIAPGVPAICDHSGRAADRINGWPKLVPTGEDGKPDAAILQASRYVDAMNFASRCKADAIMSVGFIDGVCPPSSCYAAYNVLQGKKTVINKPLMGHAAPQEIKDAFFARILEHVKQKK
jgi:cephalosporin-C deacetylase-like acetyl esterase